MATKQQWLITYATRRLSGSGEWSYEHEATAAHPSAWLIAQQAQSDGWQIALIHAMPVTPAQFKKLQESL